MGCEGCVYYRHYDAMGFDPPEDYCEKKQWDWLYFDGSDEQVEALLVMGYTEEEIEYGCTKWRADPDD